MTLIYTATCRMEINRLSEKTEYRNYKIVTLTIITSQDVAVFQ